MNQSIRYLVRIIKRGPNSDRFGWTICRQDNLLEVQRSTEIFETRTEALLHSVHAAQALAFPLAIDFLGMAKKKDEAAMSAASRAMRQIEPTAIGSFHSYVANLDDPAFVREQRMLNWLMALPSRED